MKKLKLSPMKKFMIGLFVVLVAYSIFNRMLDGVVLKALSACVKGGASIIAGVVIAYLLNPILNKMEKSKLFRSWLKLRKGKKFVYGERCYK